MGSTTTQGESTSVIFEATRELSVGRCTIAPMPQCCILLRNMFDPRNERDPNFDDDIKEEVGEECGKYGKVTSLFLLDLPCVHPG